MKSFSAGVREMNVAHFTALTVEMHAVRTQSIMMDATAINESWSQREVGERIHTPRMLWCSSISAISVMRVERKRITREVMAMNAMACVL
jgi:hypothetical protein